MEEIKDNYCLCLILFYALGTLIMMSSTFFITANDYWMYKFRNITIAINDTGDYRTELQAQFTSIYHGVHVVFNIATFLVTIIKLRQTSIIKRLLISLKSMLVLFVIVAIFVEINTDSWQMIFFLFSLLIGVLISIANGVFAVTVFQLAPKFPPQYLNVIVSGTAVSGIFSSLAQIFSLSFNVNSKISGLIYFQIGTIFIGMTIIYLLIILTKSKFFYCYYYLNEQQSDKQEKIVIDRQLFFNVIFKIRYFIIALVISIGSTSLFSPGLTALVRSVDYGNGNEWNEKYFVPVISFLCYHICDLLGREVATKIKKPNGQIQILLLSIVRTLFIPLLLFCNEQPRHHLPVLFNDSIYIVLIILIAFSNGYLINLNAVQIQLITDEKEKSTAFLVIMIVMIISIAPFSLISPLLVKTL